LKKILALILAFAMMFSVVSPISAESTNQANHDQAGKILEDLGLLKGDGKGNLGLDSNLKKQHMVVMISRLYGEGEEASKFEGINKFKDLKPKHRQDIPFITWAADKGLIKGKPDGTFGIDEEVTVQEYQTVLLRALGYEKDASEWTNEKYRCKTFI
jgi:S-layer family protein